MMLAARWFDIWVVSVVTALGMDMNDGNESATEKPSLKQRAADELKEFLIVAAYLYVCFTALTYFKAAILQANGIPFAPFGIAAVKALICAKFISIGHAVHLAERHKNQALIWPTLHKSLAFLVLLLILNVLEEVIVGYFHHRAVEDSVLNVAGGTFQQLVAASFVMLLILIPFFAFRSLGDVVGERTLLWLFFEPRGRTEKA
jgi:hypothetical protein